MKINKITISADCYVDCKSCFYTAFTALNIYQQYHFQPGINKLSGDIDSGGWSISYLMSMWRYISKTLLLRKADSKVVINETESSLKELSKFCCYLDKRYPLFSSMRTVEKLVKIGIKKNKLNYTSDEIRELFEITDFRFKRPVSQVGNERFKAMAAIGFVYGKEVFCFPWLSQERFEYYHGNLTGLLSILEKLEKIVVLPIGFEKNDSSTKENVYE